MKKLLTLLIVAFSYHMESQTFATIQNTLTNNISCGVDSCIYAADNDVNTCSMLTLNTATVGTFLVQNLLFSTGGVSGHYIGVVVEDKDLQWLTPALLAGVELTTYKNSTSNSDTKNSSQFVIKVLPGSSTRFIIEFLAAVDFDQIEVKLNSGVSGALTKLKLYYSYYSAAPLPIEIVNFLGEVKDNTVTLSWTTAKEVSNGFFTIERSLNAIDFESLETMPSQGSSSGIKHYSFTDNPPVKGIYYYRLKHGDVSSGFKYANVLSVEFTPQQNKFLLFPNPNEGRFNLNYSLEKQDIAEFIIYNNTGKKVAAYKINPLTVSMDVSPNLEKGVYYGRFLVNSEITTTQKVIVN